jgi:SAM-dependent methyltransferase
MIENHRMSDQAHFWSRAAEGYEVDFIDPDLPGVRNPLRETLAGLENTHRQTVADLGCGIGPLLPFLAERFQRVLAIDFAAGMLARARERCQGLTNVEFLQCSLTDLTALAGQVDVAVAVNSLVMPDPGDLDKALRGIHASLRPAGRFLGIVPAIDGVHYFTMLLLDRARSTGMPADKARQNAAHHTEHALYDFAFGDFRYKGLHQHFWQPFEVRYRLRQAGFRGVRLTKVRLAWEQFGCCGRELANQPPPWDWFFQARV